MKLFNRERHVCFIVSMIVGTVATFPMYVSAWDGQTEYYSGYGSVQNEFQQGYQWAQNDFHTGYVWVQNDFKRGYTTTKTEWTQNMPASVVRSNERALSSGHWFSWREKPISFWYIR